MTPFQKEQAAAAAATVREQTAMDAKVAALFSTKEGKEILAWHREKSGFDERVFVRNPVGALDPLAGAVKDGQRCSHLLFVEAIKRDSARKEGKKKQTKAKQ